MKLAIVIACVVAAGCSDAGQFDTAPGGGGPSGSGSDLDAAPAPVDAGDAGQTGLSGVLCATDNLLGLSPCPDDPIYDDVGLEHLEAELATTADPDGDWDFPAAPDDRVATIVAADSDPVFRPSIGAFRLTAGAGGPFLLRITSEDNWDTLRNSIGAGEAPGDAAAVVYVIRQNLRAPGAVAIPPDGIAQVYYDDGADGLTWDQDSAGTDANGTILMYQIQPVRSTYTFVISFDGDETEVAIPVRADTVTFATVIL